MAVPKKVLKRQTLRNIEYYGLQEIFDELYQKSLENRKFRNLMELILMEENIKLLQRILFDAIICRIRKIKTSHF